MTQFYSRLNYSFGNEDWRTERDALQIKPGDNVICITASGDRPLHLLLNDCASIVAVDANPIQNYLCELKCTAIRILDYDDYLAFLGAVDSPNRERLFHRIADHLTPEAAQFWFENLKMICDGILYQGCVERLAKYVALAARVLRPFKVKKLFSFDNIEEQKKFIREKWDSIFMRKVFEIALSRSLSPFVSNDPGLCEYLDSSINLGSYIYSRMLSSLERSLAKDNLLISLLQGYVDRRSFPPYLQRDFFHILKSRIVRIQLHTANVIEYLEKTPAMTFDRFSVSDIASYMSQNEFNRLVQNIQRTSKPGARFCIRQFSSCHMIAENMQSFFQRDTVLEQRLEEQDRCFVYRFMVGEIAELQEIEKLIESCTISEPLSVLST